jgi:serine/threonine protein phosphatase PrpC
MGRVAIAATAGGAGGRRPPVGTKLWLSDTEHGVFAIASPLGASTQCAMFVLDAIAKWVEPRPTEPQSTVEAPRCAALRSLILTAQSRWHEIVGVTEDLRGTGATLAAIIVSEGETIVAHLGDCHVYQLRDGRLLRQTRDHVQPSVDLHGRSANILTRAFGLDSNPEIWLWDSRPHDTFFLSSEVHSALTADDIVAELRAGDDAGRSAARLVSRAGEHGATDWITGLAVRLAGTAPG